MALVLTLPQQQREPNSCFDVCNGWKADISDAYARNPRLSLRLSGFAKLQDDERDEECNDGSNHRARIIVLRVRNKEAHNEIDNRSDD